MTKPNNKTITVVAVEQYDSSDFPENVTVIEMIAWLNKYLDQVPVEYHNLATVEIDTNERYDNSYAAIRIEYTRPETDEEAFARKEADGLRILQNRERIMAEYERLGRMLSTG